jgi:predicted RNase H-like nuclease
VSSESYFVGIDLAWSAHNPTGIAALRWRDGVAALVAPLHRSLLRTDDEIVEYIRQVAGQDSVIIAVDAPLIVPNEAGRRPAEAKLNAAFGKYHAGAHPANRQRLTAYNDGAIRGEVLIERLAALGIRHDAAIKPRQPARQVFEVYPHPAMVVLFGLDKILKYKAKWKHSPEQRRDAFREYQRHLRNLRESVPPALLDESLFSEESLNQRGRLLKDYEDQLDAVFCAYLALYYWWWGTQRCHVFGDLDGGYIVTPMDERIALV